MVKTQRIGSFPSWVGEAVVYQIFPDRFRRSGRVKAQQGLALQPWGTDPAEQGFQGGDLYGVIDALDHLQQLGVTCLYLTPVFSSAANHRYHAYNYFEVDPLLGGNAALDALIAAVHQRGMRLILDGVFNHCGRGFWAFHHLLENGDRTPPIATGSMCISGRCGPIRGRAKTVVTAAGGVIRRCRSSTTTIRPCRSTSWRWGGTG